MTKTELNTLDRAVLSTLVYYNSLDFPLNSSEVLDNLVHPSRIDEVFISAPAGDSVKLSDIENSLSRLKGVKIIEELNGVYHLSRPELCDLRIKRRKLAEQKWRKALLALKFLKVVPYVRLIFASGSLALHNTGKDSDLDIFLVVKSGRIWTARFLVSAVLEVLGVRRSRYDITGADKICANHYITDESLEIPVRSIYTAQLYSRLIPVIVKDSVLLGDFWSKNKWVGEYSYSWPPAENNSRIIRIGFLTEFISNLGEKILDSGFGSWLERKLRNFQLKRIKSGANQNTKGRGRVVISDSQLEFHPDSPEGRIIDKYNEKMKELGFEELGNEQDSGLI